MARRTARRLLLIVLLVIGGATATFSAYQARHIEELGRSALATSRHVDELLAILQNVRDAQQAYLVVNGQHPSGDEVTRRLAAVAEHISLIEPLVHEPRSAVTLNSLRADARALSEIETKAQDHVQFGHDLLAAEVISTEAIQTHGRMTSTLRDFRSAELSAIEADRTATTYQIWLVIGGAASLWLVGLFVLVSVPTQAPMEQPTALVPTILATAVTAESTTPPRPEPIPLPAARGTDHSDHLRQAADVCTSIGQIADAQDLEPLLTRAASVLEASGVVVWMAAGDELIAASAYGYDSRALHRLGHIHRSALNATAIAWRSGTLQVVSGEGNSRAALVAPMLGTNRCVGVLAVEVPQGRETDETIHAIARFVAAQLAATLAPWPAASVADTNVGRLEKVAEG